MYKVETAGDCYIVAGALMSMDEDGFNSVNIDPDPRRGVEAVMAFSKVGINASNISKRAGYSSVSRSL